MAQDTIPVIRVFLSSPGDVNEERKLAISLMEQIATSRRYRNQFHLIIIAWDDPRLSTVMRATLKPQEAINLKLKRPSECDIAIVIFGKRIGTPFIHTDGKEYTGTTWELFDAVSSRTTETVIYRCTKKFLFEEDDEDGRKQYRLLREFLQNEIYKHGTIQRGVNDYNSPKEFKKLFEEHFEELLEEILSNRASRATKDMILERDKREAPIVVSDYATPVKPRVWKKSPFPGLRSYTLEDEPIFFGRTAETSELVERVTQSRFVAVVGASGSGKSSLVAAGLIPYLKANSILDVEAGVSSKTWQYAFMKPGNDPDDRGNPFAALYQALVGGDENKIAFPKLKLPDLEQSADKEEFLANTPVSVFNKITQGLEGIPNGELFLFVDQFEELFTINTSEHRKEFIDFLLKAREQKNLRIVVTMRSDFFRDCLDFPDLADLINAGSYSVSVPRREALRDMITLPAEVVKIDFEDNLVETILNDTLGDSGTTPGALALMAYTLDELYKRILKRHVKTITFADYDEIGKVQGAIAQRAEDAFNELQKELQGDVNYNERLLKRGFYNLVSVTDDGTPTRKRWDYNPDDLSQDQRNLIDAFVSANLLVKDRNEDDGTETLEVAHEALFTNWERLRDWVADVTDDKILVKQLNFAANQWHKRNRPKELLWEPEHLRDVYHLPDDVRDGFDPIVKEFIAIFERWQDELENPATTPHHRLRLGDYMLRLESPRKGVGLDRNTGLPDIGWEYMDGNDHLDAYQIARYPVSVWQFEEFYKATEQFKDTRWWKNLPITDKEWFMPAAYKNRPATFVTWTMAVAFCRWMSAMMRENNSLPKNHVIRLPIQEEWLWAATGGDYNQPYPWGNDNYQHFYANLRPSEIGDATAVGMFPLGKSKGIDLYDMMGNVSEWCRNLYFQPDNMSLRENDFRVIMGGAFLDAPKPLIDLRQKLSMTPGMKHVGFRVVLARLLTDDDIID